MNDRETGSDSKNTQGWEAIDRYLPRGVWEQAERGVPDHQRLREFVDSAVELGLRHPSEVTTHRLVAAYLLANRRVPAVNAKGPLEKWALGEDVKAALRRVCKREGRQPVLVSLPWDPAELVRHDKTRELLAGRPSGPPAPPPYSDADMHAMCDSFPLRAKRPSQSPSAAVPADLLQTMGVLARCLRGGEPPAGLPGFQLLGPAAAAAPAVGGPPLARTGSGLLALPAPVEEGGAAGAGAGLQAAVAPQEAGSAAPASGAEAAGGSVGAADAAAGPARTPEAAAEAMLAALKKRPAAAPQKRPAAHQAPAAATEDGKAGTPGPNAKRPRLPRCPAEGEKVAFMGATIRRKPTSFQLHIPRELNGGPREWTVDRRFRGDAEWAFGKALETLQEKLGG